MGDKDEAFQRLMADEHLFIRFVRRFLRRVMPDTIDVEALSPQDVRKMDISFVPPELGKRKSDVLYRVRRGKAEVYVYVLIEHQSSVDYLMPFRLLSYMVLFWRHLTEKAGKKKAKLKGYMLPPVLPVVFYQGEKKWTAPTRFTEKVENARDFSGRIPEFEYLLISLRDKTSEEILAMKDGLAALIYLANPAKTEEFDEAVERVRLFLKSLSRDEADLTTDHIRGFVKILARKEGLDIDETMENVMEKEDADGMLAYAQKEFRKTRAKGREEGLRQGLMQGLRQGREEGREEGREQGREEGLQHGLEQAFREKLEIAAKLLKQGMTISLVADTLGIPEEQVREISRSLR